jgi:uncharacterized membrane protein
MRENVGELDRVMRGVFGSALVLRGLVQLIRGKEVRGLLRLLGGALVLESAVTRVCPVNAALGIDTRSKQERLTDFREDINEQSDRITAEYTNPIGFDEAPTTAP